MCYLTYIARITTTDRVFDDIEKRKEAQPFLATLRAWIKEKGLGYANLKEIMLSPMHMVMRYPILLERFYKNTPPAHPDHAQMVRALSEIKEICAEIDAVKQREDDLKKLFDLQRTYLPDCPVLLFLLFERGFFEKLSIMMVDFCKCPSAIDLQSGCPRHVLSNRQEIASL